MFRIPVCLLVWLLFIFCAYIRCSMLGPADMIFRKVQHCDPPVKNIDFWITQKRVNRSVTVLEITISNPYDIDDNVILELNGWMKKEGGFKPGALYLKDQACKVLDNILGDMFTKILNLAGTEECPLLAGNHEVKDFLFDNEKFTVPQVWGEYKMDANVFRINDGVEELQACYVVYYDMKPKEQNL